MQQHTVAVSFGQTPNEVSICIVFPSFSFPHVCIVGITMADCICCGMKIMLNIGVVIKYLLGRYFRPLCQQKANEPENLAPLYTLSLHTLTTPTPTSTPSIPSHSPKTPCVKHPYGVMIMDKCEKRRRGQEDIPEAPHSALLLLRNPLPTSPAPSDFPVLSVFYGWILFLLPGSPLSVKRASLDCPPLAPPQTAAGGHVSRLPRMAFLFWP